MFIPKKWIGKIVVVSATNGIIQGKWKEDREKHLYTGILSGQSLREIYPDEIILEFDGKSQAQLEQIRQEAQFYVEKVKNELITAKINFHVTSHNGKSPHIRFSIVGLEKYDFGVRKKYKSKIAHQILKKIQYNSEYTKLDESLHNTEHKLISIEGAPHWKSEWNGNIEEIIFQVSDQKDMEIDLEIMEEMLRSQFQINDRTDSIEGSFNNDKLVSFFEQYYQEGNRNSIILAFGGLCRKFSIKENEAITILENILFKLNLNHEISARTRELRYSFSPNQKTAILHHLYNIVSQPEEAKKIYLQFIDTVNVVGGQEILQLKLTDYYKNVKFFWAFNPFFYDENKLFWIWDKENYHWKITDETNLLVMFGKKMQLSEQVITSGIKGNYVESFRQIGRDNKPQEAPKTWIQFRNTIFDCETNTFQKVTPKYFLCNPIMVDVNDDENDIKTPYLDELFESWVGKKYVQSLYEMIAYCCLPLYKIHVIFCFVGSGNNGKSTFLDLMRKFIGDANSCDSNLHELTTSRFGSFDLYKKLLCLIAETDWDSLQKSARLKQLSSGDFVKFEAKGKNGFSEKNYAKIIVSTNSLPPSMDDTDGYHRRWFIIPFPNNFEGRTNINIIENIPADEFKKLARKVCTILPNVLKKGTFTNWGDIKQRKEDYMFHANPLKIFLKLFTHPDKLDSVRFSEFYIAYIKFLQKLGRMSISKKMVGILLDKEGIESQRATKNGVTGHYVEDIVLNLDWESVLDKIDKNGIIEKWEESKNEKKEEVKKIEW